METEKQDINGASANEAEDRTKAIQWDIVAEELEFDREPLSDYLTLVNRS